MNHISFHWGRSRVPAVEKPSYENQFKEDVNGLPELRAEELHIYFEVYTPVALSGIITDKTGKSIGSFSCSTLGDKSITWGFI